MTTKRQLAAIMFSDMAGFSSMLYTDRQLAETVRERHRSTLQRLHERYRGGLMQHFGDSTLNIYDSAVAAVECAVALQLELRQAPEIPLRIGIHTGEVLHDQAGAYGDGLSVASRVERLCPPGAVFITAKVYDDIKNHPWLTARSVGHFDLEDLKQTLEIYVVTNRGLVVPTAGALRQTQSEQDSEEEEPIATTPIGGKKRRVASFLALLFGGFGVHRFYLGQRFKGVLYFVFTGIMLIASIVEEAPFILLGWILPIIDAILFAAMPRVEFDAKFNGGKTSKRVKGSKRGKRKKLGVRKKASKNPVFGMLKTALRKYEAGHYAKAVPKFDKVLEQEPENTVAHYYLACCFSMLRDTEDAMFHLTKAVEYGFDDFDRIERERTLRHVRNTAAFSELRDRGYALSHALPPPQPDLLSQTDSLQLSALEQIEALGDRLERGELSPGEFESEKQRILGK